MSAIGFVVGLGRANVQPRHGRGRSRQRGEVEIHTVFGKAQVGADGGGKGRPRLCDRIADKARCVDTVSVHKAVGRLSQRPAYSPAPIGWIHTQANLSADVVVDRGNPDQIVIQASQEQANRRAGLNQDRQIQPLSLVAAQHQGAKVGEGRVIERRGGGDGDAHNYLPE